MWAQGSVRPLTEGALCPPASPGTEPVQVKLPQSRASAASPGTACGFLGKADGASAGDYVCGDENTLTSASRTFHVGVVPQCHQRWQAVAILGLLPALGGAKACVDRWPRMAAWWGPQRRLLCRCVLRSVRRVVVYCLVEWQRLNKSAVQAALGTHQLSHLPTQ